MSLSFVSSAVQTGTADGGFEETPIETKETEAVNRRNAHKPLFDQLRANREEDQEKKDELQRQLMRSTCALDEDDVAHLDSIERQRTDRQRQIQERTENELKEFRAARALKQQAAVSGNYDDDDDGSDNDVGTEEAVLPMSAAMGNGAAIQEKPAPVAAPRLPVIKVKKRKRRVDPTDENSKNTDTNKRVPSKQKVVDSNSEERDTLGKASSSSNETSPTFKKEDDQSSNTAKNNTESGGLGGLLSGYGSSSDEDD